MKKKEKDYAVLLLTSMKQAELNLRKAWVAMNVAAVACSKLDSKLYKEFMETFLDAPINTDSVKILYERLERFFRHLDEVSKPE